MIYRIAALALAVGLVACGPEQTAREAERQESDAITNEQKAQLDSFEGRYRGVITVDTKKYPANLVLRSFSSFLPVPGRLEIVEIPNMVGYLKVGQGNLLDRSFSFGAYNPSQGTLRLTGPGRGGDVTVFAFLELRRSGSKLVGTYFTGTLESPLELEKVGP